MTHLEHNEWNPELTEFLAGQHIETFLSLEVLISCSVLEPLHGQLELELYDVVPLVQVYDGLQGC